MSIDIDYSIEVLTAAIDEGEDASDFGKLVYSSGWQDDGRWQLLEEVIFVPSDNEVTNMAAGYYSVNYSRSGSYFTDYDYGDVVVHEVEPVEVVKTTTEYRKKA